MVLPFVYFHVFLRRHNQTLLILCCYCLFWYCALLKAPGAAPFNISDDRPSSKSLVHGIPPTPGPAGVYAVFLQDALLYP